MIPTTIAFAIGTFAAVVLGLYLFVSYIVCEDDRDEDERFRESRTIRRNKVTLSHKEAEDMWNDDVVNGRYDVLQERYSKTFTVPNLDRDASYMRELAQKRHDELLPIWEEKADEVLNKILDDIERSVLNYEAKSEFFFEDMWDENENVLNILSAKISELGYESKIHVDSSLLTTLLIVTLPDSDSESEDDNND